MTIPDRKKVISGLEHCIPDPNKSLHEREKENERRHAECPYGGKEYEHGLGCFWSLMSDALILLKEQEPKTGHWIDSAGNDKCSICGEEYSDLYPDYDNTHFCPNCGAKMKGR